MDKHPFDNLGGLPDAETIRKQSEQNQQLFAKLDNLIHRTFEQNEAGKELLALWKDALIMTPTVTPNSTQFQAGIEEGKREMIRNIILTIKKVEES